MLPISRPNDWTEWAETFCGHQGWPRGVLGKKLYFFQNKKKSNSTGNAGPFS